MTRKILTTLLCIWLSTPLAYAAASTPTSDFIDRKNGTVTHKVTGLTWMQCTVGQTWESGECKGKANRYNWYQATTFTLTFAGKNDWRAPTVDELKTIIEKYEYNPSINTKIFPNTPVDEPFWSSSPFYNIDDSAWYVYFDKGQAKGQVKSGVHYLRLVRSQ